MIVTAELSLYPLAAEDAIGEVIDFIMQLQSDGRVEVVVNQVSTQLRGELDDVLALIGQATARAFASGGSTALVIKLLNVDLPIGEPPDLRAAH